MPFVQHHKLVRHSGNQSLFEAVELAVLSVLRGRPLHLHVEGLRGTGKTSVLRSARSFLPYIKRVRGCIQNCDPKRPHCPHHRQLDTEELAGLGTEWIPMPFLEISHSAKLGTVVGSIDLSRLTDADNAEASLLPGTLARAHRGVVVVDEINRLADTSPELTDVLLDVLGTKPGQLQIEETGLSPVSMPIDISVWAASNPDEEPGPLEDIRRQLADRFDLVINVERPDSPEAVAEILKASGAVHTRFQMGSLSQGRETRSRLTKRTASPWPRFPRQLLESLGHVYVDFGLESLRALEAWHLSAACLALKDETGEVEPRHLIKAAPWALHHRVELNTLSEILRFLDEKLGAEEADGEDDSGRGRGTVPASGAVQSTEAGSEKAGRDREENMEDDGPFDRMFSPLRGMWESLTGSSRHQVATGYGPSGQMGNGDHAESQKERGHTMGDPNSRAGSVPDGASRRQVPSPPNPAKPLVFLEAHNLWRGEGG